MTVQCQIENPWGLLSSDPVSGNENFHIPWFFNGPAIYGIPNLSIGQINIDNLVNTEATIRFIYYYPENNGTQITTFLKDGVVISKNSRVPEFEFDDYYSGLDRIVIAYDHDVSGVIVRSNLTINFEEALQIRTVFDLATALHTAGISFGNEEFLLNRDNLTPPQIRCVDTETGDVTVTVMGNPITDTDIQVTIVDGDPPMTSLTNGNSSIFVDDQGSVRMQAANDEGQPTASFFLTEHGAGGFNVNGSFFANGNREASFGGGGHTFTLDGRGYTFRHNREEVTFTFDEIKRLKDLIG